MEHDDFLDVFYSNLKAELDNDNFVDSIEKLINNNKLNKNNFLKLLKGEYYE